MDSCGQPVADRNVQEENLLRTATIRARILKNRTKHVLGTRISAQVTVPSLYLIVKIIWTTHLSFVNLLSLQKHNSFGSDF